MEDTKFVAMVYLVCKTCGHEYPVEIAKLNHSSFDVVGCLACEARHNQRVPIKILECTHCTT